MIGLAASIWRCCSCPWWYGREQQAFVCGQNSALHGVTAGFQTSQTGENYTLEFLSPYECFISHVNRSESHSPSQNHPLWHRGSCVYVCSEPSLQAPDWISSDVARVMKTGSVLLLKEQHSSVLEKDVLMECTCEKSKAVLSFCKCEILSQHFSFNSWPFYRLGNIKNNLKR